MKVVMKIFANKDIRNLFLTLSGIGLVSFLVAEGILWLTCHEISVWLFLIFVLGMCAVWAACFLYFRRQNKAMEQAVSQINAYLDGNTAARIECDSEGELYRLLNYTSHTGAGRSRKKLSCLALMRCFLIVTVTG